MIPGLGLPGMGLGVPGVDLTQLQLQAQLGAAGGATGLGVGGMAGMGALGLGAA